MNEKVPEEAERESALRMSSPPKKVAKVLWTSECMWPEQRWGHPDPAYYENLFEWIGVTWVLQAISNAGRTAQLKTSEKSLASSGCARQRHIPRHPGGAHAKCGVLQPRTDEVECGEIHSVAQFARRNRDS
jgi:hypothetical protein